MMKSNDYVSNWMTKDENETRKQELSTSQSVLDEIERSGYEKKARKSISCDPFTSKANILNM